MKPVTSTTNQRTSYNLRSQSKQNQPNFSTYQFTLSTDFSPKCFLIYTGSYWNCLEPEFWDVLAKKARSLNQRGPPASTLKVFSSGIFPVGFQSLTVASAEQDRSCILELCIERPQTAFVCSARVACKMLGSKNRNKYSKFTIILLIKQLVGISNLYFKQYTMLNVHRRLKSKQSS